MLQQDSPGWKGSSFWCFSRVPRNRCFVLCHYNCYNQVVWQFFVCHLFALVSRNCCSSFPSPTPSTPSRLRKQVSPLLLSTPRGPRQCVARRGIVFLVPFRFSRTQLSMCAPMRNWLFLHASLISSSSSAVPLLVHFSLWLLSAASPSSSKRLLHSLASIIHSGHLFFPSGKTFCRVCVTTSRVKLHTSSEHSDCAAPSHLSTGNPLANSSKRSKNSCLFSPCVTHLMSSVLSILILASAYGLHLRDTSISMATGMCSLLPLVRNGYNLLSAIGSVLQERTNPMASCSTTVWSIRLDLPWSAKKVLPMSFHVVATAEKLSCAVFLISRELLFSSLGLLPLHFRWWSPFFLLRFDPSPKSPFASVIHNSMVHLPCLS